MFEYLFALMLIDLMESFYFLGKSSFLFAIIVPFCWKSKNIIKNLGKRKGVKIIGKENKLFLIEKIRKERKSLQ